MQQKYSSTATNELAAQREIATSLHNLVEELRAIKMHLQTIATTLIRTPQSRP